MFGEVSFCQKTVCQQQNDLFRGELQICENNSSPLIDSYEVYLKEVDSFHSKESIPSSCFDQGAQGESQFFGVVTLDKGSNTPMISFVDISPDDVAELPLEKASYVTEDARERDTEDAYFITIDGEAKCATPISSDDISLNEVFSATEDCCKSDIEQDFLASFGDLFEPSVDEKCLTSSLTLVANPGLDLSQSLTDRCFQMANLAVTSESLAADKLIVQKRIRSLSADVEMERETSPVQLMETADSSDELSSNLFVGETLSVSTLLQSEEENLQESPMSSQRYRIVQEIVETEKKYCSCLGLLQDHFAEKLSSSRIVEQYDAQMIFPCCLRQIYAFHRNFCGKLEARLSNWTRSSTIADLMFLLVQSTDCDLLKHYQTYVDLYSASLLHLRRLCQLNSAIESLIKDLERESCCQGLDLNAYLLTPVQRIPRYVLFLKELAKCTAEGHPDFHLIELCLSKLKEFLGKLDDNIHSSAKFVGIAALPKSKRRFNFSSKSFRYYSASNADAGQTSSLREQKNSSGLKTNRISLDLSFLGTLRHKKEAEVVNKRALSEMCLHESETVDSSLPPSRCATLTPQNSAAFRSFQSPQKISQVPIPPVRSELNGSSIQSIADMMETCGNFERKLARKTRIIKRSKDADFSPLSASSVCESYIGVTPEKKSKLETLSEMLHLSPKKNGELKRRTSVRDAIKTFFVRRGPSKRTYCQNNSSASDGNKDSNC